MGPGSLADPVTSVTPERTYGPSAVRSLLLLLSVDYVSTNEGGGC
jgi:hypothetical protein